MRHQFITAQQAANLVGEPFVRYQLDSPPYTQYAWNGKQLVPQIVQDELGGLSAAGEQILSAYQASAAARAASTPIPEAQLVTNWAQYGTVNGTFTNSTDPVLGQVLNINVTTPGTRQYARRKLGIQMQNFAGLSFWVKRDANCTVIDMEITVGDYASSRRMIHNKGVSALEVGAWTRVVVPLSEFESTGGNPTTADANFITSLAIGPTAAGGQTTTLQIAGLTAHDCGSRGTVSFQFDDARLDTYTEAYRVMREYRYPGAVAAEYHRLGTTPSYPLMTLSNVRELYAAGWDVLGHHIANMPAASEAAQIAIHEGNKEWMRTNGFARGDHIWVWPGGARDALSEQYARRYWQVTRRVGSLAYAGIPGVFDTSSPQNYYVVSSSTAASLLAVVDKVRAYGGNVVFVFHGLVNNKVAAEDCLISDFEELCRGVFARGVPVLPVSKVWTKT